ncbi:MAG: lytic transglycosylase domain-containing protein [Rhodocyclaceae bacterium]|nr:lytic transglycosylase domain-containing protein [Rhodocyclaceae bacterium]
MRFTLAALCQAARICRAYRAVPRQGARRSRAVLWCAGLAVSAALAQGAWASRATDNAFSGAREAFRDGRADLLEQHAARLEGHVLQPYADYWRLRMRIDNAEPASIEAFLKRMEGQYLADRLRHDWARLQAKRGEWAGVIATTRGIRQPDPDIPCLAAQAQLALGDLAGLGDSRPLWLSGNTLSDACEALFGQLRERGQIDAADLRRRRLLALDTGDARVLARLGGGDWALDAARLQRANDKPDALLAAAKPGMRPDAALLVAILRRARSDALAAHEALQSLRSQLAPEDTRWLTGRLAFYAARQHLPQSPQWFAQADPALLADEDWAWQTRLALRRGDWPAVLHHIERMSREAQNEQAWRFWRARALQAAGREGEANAILAGLAGEPTFYGQLANEALGPSIGERSRDYLPPAAEVQAMATRPGFARGLELHRLGFDFEATREWSWGIAELSDEQLIAGAELARRQGWFERSIWTAERTRRLHNHALRYPTPFTEQVRARATHHTVDPALLYGLIRQESRFNPQATSSAGARGLMQVMPATASWLAKKLGMHTPSDKALGDPALNVQLGSAYVRHLLDTLEQSPVLVAAGYNAGPRRAQRWRDQKPLEGAIYAESIPIGETRDYVKKVLANATVYGRQFGAGALSLRDRLGIIPGRRGAAEWDVVLIDNKDLREP